MRDGTLAGFATVAKCARERACTRCASSADPESSALVVAHEQRGPESAPPPDPAAAPAGPDAEAPHDEDRAAILARRRALVKRSLASIGAIVVGGLTTMDCAPTPCLDIALPTDAVDADAADAPEGGNLD